MSRLPLELWTGILQRLPALDWAHAIATCRDLRGVSPGPECARQLHVARALRDAVSASPTSHAVVGRFTTCWASSCRRDGVPDFVVLAVRVGDRLVECGRPAPAEVVDAVLWRYFRGRETSRVRCLREAMDEACLMEDGELRPDFHFHVPWNTTPTMCHE